MAVKVPPLVTLAAVTLVLASVPAAGLPVTPQTAPTPEAVWSELKAPAQEAYEARGDIVGPVLDPRMGPFLDRAGQDLDALDPTVAAMAEDPGSLAGAVALGQAATRSQAAMLDADTEATLETSFASPSEAAEAIADRHGELDADQREAFAALDELPQPLREDLTRFLAAFLAFDDAAQRSFTDVDLGPLVQGASEGTLLPAAGKHPAPRTSDAEAPWTEPELRQALGLDLGPILSARLTLLDASLALAETLAATDEAAIPASATLDECPTLAVDLEATNTTYPDDCRLILDAGGNDTYENNAGGSNLRGGSCPSVSLGPSLIEELSPRATALVDLAADGDVYGDADDMYDCGANGGGFLGGAAFLLDGGGDDDYRAHNAAINGGSLLGSGFLLDAGGNDSFDTEKETRWGAGYGNAGINGGGHVAGSGALVDAGGDDVYTGSIFAVNGGGYLGGHGLLVEAGGADLYRGGCCGTNGGARDAGHGTLIDATGDDEYRTPHGGGSHGGASFGARGLLVDLAGDDARKSWSGLASNGGAAIAGVGTVLDASGDDFNRVGGLGANGGGRTGGVGVLVDATGADTYKAGSYGTNGGGNRDGAGFLHDAAGDDTYVAGHGGANGAGSGSHDIFAVPAPLGLGHLFDGAGTDTYEDDDGGSGTDRTVVPKGTYGAQIDASP